MSVEFDPESQPVSGVDAIDGVSTGNTVEVGEVLAGPPRLRRNRVAIATAVAVALVAGGVAVGLAGTSASASPASVLAAASSSASTGSSSSGAAKPRPTRPAGSGAFQPGQPIVFGTVKTVKGTTITITDQQGFTRTIVTSAKTTYANGLTAAPAVGAKIIAQGTVDANGTTLDATKISGLPTGLTGPGGSAGGPGGFGRAHGPNGPRPTGTPTGTPPSGGFHPGDRGKPQATTTPTAKPTA
jgi:hypothetical protein